MTPPDDSGLKSSFELAMERLEQKEGKLAPLSDHQKATISEIDERTRSRIAEIEIMYEKRLVEARASGEAAQVTEIEAERRRELEKARARGQREKDAVREEA